MRFRHSVLAMGLSVAAMLLNWGCGIADSNEAACLGDDDPSIGTQGALSFTTSPAAVSTPGASVQVEVYLTSASNTPLCGRTVRWIPGPGSGTVTPTSGVTGAVGLLGRTSATWTLPLSMGITASLTAEVTGSDPLIQTTTTTSTPPSTPNALARHPAGFPEPQSGSAGQPVALPPSVLVTDQVGQPMGGVPVDFAVTAGGGRLGSNGLSSVQVTTNAAGVASVQSWILGSPGSNVVRAVLSGTAAFLDFTANAAASPGGAPNASLRASWAAPRRPAGTQR